MTPLVEFEILGLPAPQGSHTAIRMGDHARVIPAGSKSGRAKHKAWRTAVAEAARDVAGEQPHDGPLRLVVEFRFPLPKSRPAAARHAGRWPHMVKPDVDKVLRATLDGLTAGGLIVDDSRICALEVDSWEVAGWTGAIVSLQQIELAA